jgi:hypothetical protein
LASRFLCAAGNPPAPVRIRLAPAGSAFAGGGLLFQRLFGIRVVNDYHAADDNLVDFQPALDLLNRLGLGCEPVDAVKGVLLFLQRERQLALALVDSLVLDNLRTLGADNIEHFSEIGVDLGFLDGRVQQKDDLVLLHRPSPFGQLGPRRSRRGNRGSENVVKARE